MRFSDFTCYCSLLADDSHLTWKGSRNTNFRSPLSRSFSLLSLRVVSSWESGEAHRPSAIDVRVDLITPALS
jgi:hypothetical protein